MAGYTINDKHDLRGIEEALDTFPRLKERLRNMRVQCQENSRINICKAIILRPRVILIDEPSLGLAPAIVEQAFKHIENIAKGMSILLVEQNASRGHHRIWYRNGPW